MSYEFTSIDPNDEWVRRMALEATSVFEEFRPDIILTQSTPFQVHLIGLHMPDEMRRRWIAYFSDLWPLSLTPVPYRTGLSVLMKPLHMRALNKVAKATRSLLFSNAVAARRAAEALTDAPACIVVSHIGEPSTGTTPGNELVQRYATRFVHVGKLTRERISVALIDALRSIGDKWADRGFTGITFVGDVVGTFREACSDLERSGLVDFIGEVSPDTARNISSAAKALVVIEADMDESPFLASKFADYAMLRKPILAICPRGPMSEMLAVHGGGIAAPHDDKAIVAAIDLLLASEKQEGSETLAREFAAQRVASTYIDAFRKLL
ncbi:hypothetical protein [Caballeronia zhejiangensis]|uniref:hypothetical protein n=1 Tax=Caballeronia zhejiangensis TaxID=871203 RepID=UPI001F5214B4|nr:hypothetical protein [Caballeronia zhejiangensis]MCI1047005.1 hypothetical protein [Caballeronia zhejiangensis]